MDIDSCPDVDFLFALVSDSRSVCQTKHQVGLRLNGLDLQLLASFYTHVMYLSSV